MVPIQSKVYEKEEVLIPSLPESACTEQGYITPQQVYNLLNTEDGQPAWYDPYYMLVLDCRSPERYKDSYVLTVRAAVAVIHPELGCLNSCKELQKYSIILLYAEQVRSPVGSAKAKTDSPDLQCCFFQLSGLGMDPVILLGGFSAFYTLYPFLCTSQMVLSATPSPSTPQRCWKELSARALPPASDYQIIKNLHITHVVNATASSPDAFPNKLLSVVFWSTAVWVAVAAQL